MVKFYLSLSTFLLTVFLSICNQSLSLAQLPNGKINGHVVDEEKKPIEFANIILKGQPYHTSTKADGTFTLTAPVGNYTQHLSLRLI